MSKKNSMTPEIFFENLVKLYADSRSSKFPDDNIHRGRSVSISGYLEDLFAKYIATNNPKKECNYFIDQPMTIPSLSTLKCPDIVIQNKANNVITDLVDMKTDLGWNRNGMPEFCAKWNELIQSLKGVGATFKEGKTKQKIEGTFSNKLHLHIVVASRVNCGPRIREHYKEINKLNNVSMYILSDKVHPNEYKTTSKEILKTMEINSHEFKRLLNKISEQH